MKRISLRVIVPTAIAVAAVYAAIIPTGGQVFGARHAASNSLLVFLRNGNVIGTRGGLNCEPQSTSCNEIEIDWAGGKCFTGAVTEYPPVVVVPSTQGQDNGQPRLAPCVRKVAGQDVHDSGPRPTNDVEYVPSSTGTTTGTQTISQAWWTYNGVQVERVLPPEVWTGSWAHRAATSAPDAMKLYLDYTPAEHVTAVKLRVTGGPTQKIPVPKGTNGVEFFGFKPSVVP